MIYLASPYSHPDRFIQRDRYHSACYAAAEMIKAGIPAFSPIVHSHILHERHGCGGDFETWQRLDRDLIHGSEKLVVLMLDGWRESVGVTAEIAYADELGIPVVFLSMNDVLNSRYNELR